MKNLRFLCAVSLLTLALTVPSFAGEITTMVAEPSPPPAADGQISTMVAGQTDNGLVGQMTTMNSEASDPVTEIALTLLHSVLSLF